MTRTVTDATVAAKPSRTKKTAKSGLHKKVSFYSRGNMRGSRTPLVPSHDIKPHHIINTATHEAEPPPKTLVPGSRTRLGGDQPKTWARTDFGANTAVILRRPLVSGPKSHSSELSTLLKTENHVDFYTTSSAQPPGF